MPAESTRIKDVQTHLITANWTGDPWFTPALHSAALVRIITEDGRDGWGEATVGYFLAESVPPVVEFFKPMLLDRNAMDISLIARAMYDEAIWWARSGIGRSVIAALEIALWDLKGKALRVPVYQLLGGKARDSIPVYASGGASIWPIQENAKKLNFYASLGYRAAKLSTGFYEIGPTAQAQAREVARNFPFATSLKHIAENFQNLRRELGPEFDLAIDGHQGAVPNPIPVAEAIEIALALAPHRLQFYEEPLAYSDIDGYVKLCARSPIPIAGGESLCGLDQFHTLIQRQGLQIVQPDLGFVGGLGEALRIVHHADAYNITAAIHTGGSVGPSLAASWHLAAATNSVRWLEHVVASRKIQHELLVEPFTPSNGLVPIPTAPGLGLNIDLDRLQRYRFIPGSGERT
jgi:L-alanine-DL-glutamate epimerase-like enolase superfamily enzyme